MAWARFAGTLIDRHNVTENIFRANFEISTVAPGHDYSPLRVGDESVGLYFARDGVLLGTRETTVPGAHGGWETVEDEANMGRRNLTVRAFDPATGAMSIDVAHHASGVAIDWFDSARPGWRVLMAGARSWHRPPTEASGHHCLIADLAGLPALARILEGTDPGIDVTAVAEVLSPGDLDYLPPHPRLDLVPLIGSGNGVTASRLADHIQQMPGLETASYHWIAAETAQVRHLKKHLRGLGVDKSQCVAIGYWTDETQWSEQA
ncbi:siderophore-interacting protein [Glutamicibacter sp. JL.03c]|uniref:siderophore-interacting protein n=1 Tax=Glutamicibacter sp. JL.03c TaxID=2984842 RepID=UPI0021F7BDA8|nr:siderophore-interacting protein [Glutamicibacter sp. JL.03c]UYQ77771.1 siderophore-interacting protein [Glutamicibacter sp. JL.03c]